MSLLAVNRAIRARLRGEPVDAQGRSKAKEGVLIPMLKNRSKTSSQSTEGNWDAEFVPNSFRQIPVYHYKDDGKLWETIVPRVMFGRIGIERDPEQSVTEDRKVGESGAPVEITNRAGETISGHENNVMRKRPESYTYMYQFSIVAESDTERSLILESLLRVFPARTFLKYVQRDGSFLIVDMLQDSIVDQDQVIGEFEDRQACETVLTYNVEAFEDTTPFTFEVTAVIDARIEMADSSDPADPGKILEVVIK